MISKRKITLAAALALCLGGCAMVPEVRPDPATAQQLRDGAPAPGYARVYWFDGRLYAGDSASSSGFRADLFADGIKVGGLNGGDMLVLDLPAATHTLIWRDRGIGGNYEASKPLMVDLQSGQRIFVSNDARMAPIFILPVPIPAGAVAGAIVGGVAGAASGALSEAVAAGHPQGVIGSSDDGSVGLFMMVRPNGAEMSRDDTVVLPDPQAVARLAQAR